MSVESLKKQAKTLCQLQFDVCWDGHKKCIGSKCDLFVLYVRLNDVLPLIAELKAKLEGKSKKIRRLSAGLAGARSCIKHDLQPQVKFYRKQNKELEGRLSEIQKLVENHPTIKVIPIPIDDKKCSMNCGQSTYEEYIIDDIEWLKKLKLAVLLKEGKPKK